MAAITYSALIMNELLMTGLEVHTWHPLMFVAELGEFWVLFGAHAAFQRSLQH